MCGICGIVNFGAPLDTKEALVREMMEVTRHRGPDESGFFSDKFTALGHNRLSIIDLSTGQQPMFNEDETISIIFNGEIYNYKDIRTELQKKGHTFRTKSDTETILHLYEEKGSDCVIELRGMFTFAIWDSKKNTLILARDRLGIKPLYYSIIPNGICFASEIKSLLKAKLVRKELNFNSVDQYITLNYTLGPETILKNVFKLMPGYVLEFTRKGIHTRRYWDYSELEQSHESFETCLQNIGRIIEESVRMRLMSEVPLGAFLSGGVDSSVVVGVMARFVDKPVKTFTVGYEDAEDVNELRYARLVARHFKTEHHEFILKPQKFMEIVEKVVWHLDEPVAEFATIPLLLLSELAKKYVTVMLSGEGADEVFGGYPIYRFMQMIEFYQKAPQIFRKKCVEPLAGLFLKRIKEGKYLNWMRLPLHERYLGNGSYFNSTMKDKLYTQDFKKRFSADNVSAMVNKYYERVRSRDPIGQMLYLDTKTWLVEDLLIKADKMTMASGIELRVPFLDHKLVEYAATIPSWMKVNKLNSKYIFKSYAKKFVPKEIVFRKKQGFPVPVKQWMRKELKSGVKEVLLDRRSRERGLFNPNYIKSMFEQHEQGSQDYSKNLWNLLVLELWMRKFIDGGTA